MKLSVIPCLFCSADIPQNKLGRSRLFCKSSHKHAFYNKAKCDLKAEQQRIVLEQEHLFLSSHKIPSRQTNIVDLVGLA